MDTPLKINVNVAKSSRLIAPSPLRSRQERKRRGGPEDPPRYLPPRLFAFDSSYGGQSPCGGRSASHAYGQGPLITAVPPTAHMGATPQSNTAGPGFTRSSHQPRSPCPSRCRSRRADILTSRASRTNVEPQAESTTRNSTNRDDELWAVRGTSRPHRAWDKQFSGKRKRARAIAKKRAGGPYSCIRA